MYSRICEYGHSIEKNIIVKSIGFWVSENFINTHNSLCIYM